MSANHAILSFQMIIIQSFKTTVFLLSIPIQVLGYLNIRDTLAKHIDNEDENTVTFRDGIRGNPNIAVINEPGLYSLFLFSTKGVANSDPLCGY